MESQAQSPNLQNKIPPVEFRASELIAEFNEIKEDANAGAAPSVINQRYNRWEKKTREVLGK